MTSFRLQGCREKTLKYIHCRPVLVAICALVVIECACVLSELMVDLQGIKWNTQVHVFCTCNALTDSLTCSRTGSSSTEARERVEDPLYVIQSAIPTSQAADRKCVNPVLENK
ncbi:hypothetical protein PoB_002753500 [Plakobranchus ocellatus]|uniref:Uncharacterized protein n=1 Tax=Plakobranchus ocellatus TaxID=259542 RepID=A0AAV3ZYU8_9GAST|nr:hypothetical protein PoB_002753500 [Plakobranchus ocellatus]